jgi:hypothetical protein
VATNALSTTWFGRSRKKLRSSRGENWVEDSCSATTVRPSSSAMMVMTVPVIPNSKVRASSAVPWKASGDRGPTLTDDSAAPTARATSTDSVGSTHSDPRTYSLSTPRPTMPASAILIRYRASTYPAGQFAKRGAGATAPVARRSRRPGNPCRNCRHAALALMLTAPGQMISRVLGTHQPARSESVVAGTPWSGTSGPTQRGDRRPHLLRGRAQQSSRRNACGAKGRDSAATDSTRIRLVLGVTRSWQVCQRSLESSQVGREAWSAMFVIFGLVDGGFLMTINGGPADSSPEASLAAPAIASAVPGRRALLYLADAAQLTTVPARVSPGRLCALVVPAVVAVEPRGGQDMRQKKVSADVRPSLVQ